jgi:hypothetical protein
MMGASITSFWIMYIATPIEIFTSTWSNVTSAETFTQFDYWKSIGLSCPVMI